MPHTHTHMLSVLLDIKVFLLLSFFMAFYYSLRIVAAKSQEVFGSIVITLAIPCLITLAMCVFTNMCAMIYMVVTSLENMRFFAQAYC